MNNTNVTQNVINEHIQDTDFKTWIHLGTLSILLTEHLLNKNFLNGSISLAFIVLLSIIIPLYALVTNIIRLSPSIIVLILE